MFWHNFKYSFRTLFRNKGLIFWTFAFPIILGTLFHMAFQDIEKNEKLDIIDIAIVENEAFLNDAMFRKTFEALGEEKEEQVFQIQYVEEEKAKELLLKKEIVGYFFLDSSKKANVVIMQNGISETVFQSVVERIVQTNTIFQNIIEIKIRENIGESISQEESLNLENWYQQIYENIIDSLEEETNQIVDCSSKNLSYTMIEYYTLIAMTCLYGGIIGMYSINQCLANMSSKGKRTSISSISKGKLILSSACASYIAQLLGLLLLFLYTIFIIHVDYGSHFLFTVLLSLVGSLAGLSLGIFTSSVFKASENAKVGIMISLTMFGCVLSGMMGITMKYIIDKNIPLLNQINPVNMITDGFYSLYYYDTFDRYYFNVFCLFIFAFIMLGISIFYLRRQKYDCI